MPVEAFLESYVEWTKRCEELRLAYERWSATTAPARATAFESYSAALDREDRAHETCAKD